MFRPINVAPTLANDSSTTVLLSLTTPPSSPRQADAYRWPDGLVNPAGHSRELRLPPPRPTPNTWRLNSCQALERHLLNRFAEETRGRGARRQPRMRSGPRGELHDQGVTVVGVDLSPRMIQCAMRLNPGLEFRVRNMGDSTSPAGVSQGPSRSIRSMQNISGSPTPPGCASRRLRTAARRRRRPPWRRRSPDIHPG
jgi:hypothetical protein